MRMPDYRKLSVFAHACLILLALTLLSSCSSSDDSVSEPRTEDEVRSEVVYAEKFSLGWDSGFRVVKVFSPEHALAHTYVLMAKEDELPGHLHGATVVRVPVRSVTCETGFHVSLLDMLGCIEAIKGVSGKRRIGQDEIHERIDRGELAVTGYMRGFNMETMLKLDPDLAFVNVTSVSSDVFEKLNLYGVQPGYFCASLEEHPLGALEWIKFMGAFFQKDSLASELFHEREKAYLAVQQKVAAASFRPSVIAGYSRKGAWSTMGSSRWFSTMLDHAGASYLFQGSGLERGHLLSPEAAMEAGTKAEYWVNTHFRVNDLDGLLGMDNRYALFASVIEKKVYNNNNACFSNGRSRFWDVGMTEPHVILGDLVSIFHPEILPDHTPVYYHRLVSREKQ